MNMSGLSLDQAPPYSVILRFFITAQIFGILAGIVLAVGGETILASRYAPISYVFVHLITIGVMGMTMIGALFQMLPVIAGVKLPSPQRFSLFVYLLLIAGVSLLSYGFFSAEGMAFVIGGTMLVLAFGSFAALAILRLRVAEFPSSAIWLIRLALTGVIIAILLGANLAFSRATGSLDHASIALTTLHIGWGFAIWTLLLIMGVSRQVLPMFYVAPQYPNICCRTIVPLIYFAMIALSFSLIFDVGAAYMLLIAKISALLSFVAFGVTTLYLLYKRKRKIGDPTLVLWRFAIASLIVSAPLLLIEGERHTALLATLFVGGFVLAIINAMTYKIVPFLAWFHLSAMQRTDIPMMGDFVSKRSAYMQAICFMAAIVTIAVAIYIPALTITGGALLALSYLLILKDTVLCIMLYRKHLS
ncbi:hypothetical protein AGMMS50229_05130 [Campylobacterota bacterium]|nr:hypothetical protein AGMMS50229_05130 [Campylobacterota bacterium]